MNVMNTSGDELPECPLCMEPLEVDDLSFYPCTCGYQICRFCWHRIRTDENELCPACRKAYPENPADFKPLTQEQISALKAEKRQRDQQRKQKITENRKHLANVRVVQKNLVFVVGLPPRLADAEILKKHEYFGKYGKIHKVVINPSTTYAGVQGPSASAYVTYVHNNDALRAIQSVNNITIDGRSIKTSLGTTKYCSHFMKNQVCPKPDCMYLHELGDTEASFTKEEMHQGKHQEYEKRLHDSLIAQMQQQSQQTSTNPSANGSTSPPNTSPDNIASSSSPSASSSSTSVKSGADIKDKDAPASEAWPSLSTSPVPIKESKTNGKANGNKENTKNEANRRHTEKVKGDKTKGKTQKQTARDKVKAQQTNGNSNNINSNNNLEDELGDLDDTDDTISSTTDSGTISESDSGKSSPPSSFPDPVHPGHHNIINVTATTTPATTSASLEQIAKQQNDQQKSIISSSSTSIIETSDITSLYTNVEKVKDGGITDTSARLSKLGLFDDNSSFFSRGFNSFPKLDGSSEHSQAMNNAQLPDLLNGTVNNNNMSLDLDQKQLLKNLGSFGSMSNHGGSGNENTHDDWESAFKYLMKNKQYEDQQQQEEWLRQQELRKHSGLSSGLGLNQFNNMFNNDNVDNNMFAQNEISRMMFNQQYSQQQQQRMNHNNADMNHVHPSMSKFFDFHKNQQQQQQNQFMMNSNPLTDQLNQLNLLDSHHRMNGGSGFLDQQSHLQKQRLMNNKYDGGFNSQQNRMHQNPTQYMNQSVEDDLGFDPFKETQKALAELINDEVSQQQQINGNSGQRARMPPPPGFNHIQNNSFNSFSGASPRTQSGSKFPFVNMQNTSQMQQPPQNNWPMHMGFNQNSNDGGFSQHQNNQPQQQHKSSGFGNNFSDWSSLSLDPAIVSFRQFPQFNPQQQQQQQQQQAQQQNQPNGDMYTQMSQMNQGFGMNHGMNMQNNLQSQTSPAQVFSHSNLLNNYHMNSMPFDKFSMPSIPPPGFQSGNGKTECIN